MENVNYKNGKNGEHDWKMLMTTTWINDGDLDGGLMKKSGKLMG
ncbi:MAG: hypothetical protein ACKVRN_09615 [Pyrinomonadaceae bacterium]